MTMPHVLISNSKCTGCHMCELACSAWHEGGFQPSLSRLRVVVNPTAGKSKGYVCLQSACRKCVPVCPVGALTESDGLVKVDEDLCDACSGRPGGPACVDVCPMGVIAIHPTTGKAFKCDLCDGEPQCIRYCQNPEVAAVSLKADRPRAEKA
jgi:anaerobic carbon-monoxide dehydrogenase iron sulfur subunit